MLFDFGRLSKRDAAISIEYSKLYDPPEGISTEDTPEADMWACGVLLYYLVTNSNPFVHNSVLKQRSGLADVDMYEMRADAFSRISPELSDLIRGMLEVDPQDRISAKRALRHAWVKTWLVKELAP
jgi:serine/threonine protein kinase